MTSEGSGLEALGDGAGQMRGGGMLAAAQELGRRIHGEARELTSDCQALSVQKGLELFMVLISGDSSGLLFFCFVHL